jgi:hypothetical protein
MSPVAEGFRATFRRPSLTLGEIMWRWSVGATAAALFLYGLFEYLGTLPVTSGEMLFLRTRQPYLVAQVIAHIFRGSLSRVVMAGLLAGLMLGWLWIVAASLGRMATVRVLLDHFRGGIGSAAGDAARDGGIDLASNVSTNSVLQNGPMRALGRINFLRAAVALAAVFGFVGAALLAGFASPHADPRPGLAFLLFLPMAGLICFVWWALNWLLSLSGMFAVRDGEEAVRAISAAVAFCRERTGAVFAVSTWTGLAHLVAFVGATTVVSVPLGFAGVLPWRLIVLGVILVTLAYFALADWLYMARLAGYVCIAEMPEVLLVPLPRAPTPRPSPSGLQPAPTPPLRTTIDRDEPILSDVPNPAGV